MPGICAYQPNDSGGSSDDNSINRAPHFVWRNGNRPEVGESHHPVDQFSTTSNSSGEEREYQIETERRWQVVSSDSSSTSSLVQLQVERTDSSSTTESADERESSRESFSTDGDALEARRAALSRELDEDRPESKQSTLSTSLLASKNSESIYVPQRNRNEHILMSPDLFRQFLYWLVCYPFEILWNEWRYHSAPAVQQAQQRQENEGKLLSCSNWQKRGDKIPPQLRGKRQTTEDGTTIYYDFDERFIQLSKNTETKNDQPLGSTPQEYLSTKDMWMHVLNYLLLSSSDNKWEVLKDLLTCKQEVIYVPKDTTEDFQRVGRHLHVRLLYIADQLR